MPRHDGIFRLRLLSNPDTLQMGYCLHLKKLGLRGINDRVQERITTQTQQSSELGLAP